MTRIFSCPALDSNQDVTTYINTEHSRVQYVSVSKELNNRPYAYRSTTHSKNLEKSENCRVFYGESQQ